MKQTDRALAEYYARRSGEYERIYHRPERQADLRVLEGIVRSRFSGGSVLEVASGTGYWTEQIARGGAARVVAVDSTEEVLDIAAHKRYGACDVEFVCDDAYSLGRIDESFRFGFAGFWWSHVPVARIESFLTVFHTKFEPGARVLFLDNCYVEGNSTPISRRDAAGDTWQIRKLDDGSRFEVRKNFPTDDEIRSALSPFSDAVEVQRLTYYWLVSYTLRH